MSDAREAVHLPALPQSRAIGVSLMGRPWLLADSSQGAGRISKA
jgi:hypothetical protein